MLRSEWRQLEYELELAEKGSVHCLCVGIEKRSIHSLCVGIEQHKSRRNNVTQYMKNFLSPLLNALQLSVEILDSSLVKLFHGD